MKKSGYKTFNKSTRYKLEALYNARLSIKRIAEELGYTYHGVYYELQRGYYMHRNTDWTETKKYSADKAQLVVDINATAKGAPISEYSDSYIQYVQNFINNYPRAIFNGENSSKRFAKELEKLNIKNFLLNF